MIDDFLKDFLPYPTRKKLYSGAAILSLLFTGASTAVVTDNAEAYPVVGMILGLVTAAVALLARANAAPDAPTVVSNVVVTNSEVHVAAEPSLTPDEAVKVQALEDLEENYKLDPDQPNLNANAEVLARRAELSEGYMPVIARDEHGKVSLGDQKLYNVDEDGTPEEELRTKPGPEGVI